MVNLLNNIVNGIIGYKGLIIEQKCVSKEEKGMKIYLLIGFGILVPLLTKILEKKKWIQEKGLVPLLHIGGWNVLVFGILLILFLTDEEITWKLFGLSLLFCQSASLFLLFLTFILWRNERRSKFSQSTNSKTKGCDVDEWTYSKSHPKHD